MAANIRATSDTAAFPLSDPDRDRWIRLLETLAPPVRHNLERFILEACAIATAATSRENPTD